MRILQVNKFFWEHAGPERYMFEISDLLKAKGHHVEYFSMKHERNLASDNSEYFVNNIEFREEGLRYRLKNIGAILGKTIYSPESRRNMAALLRSTEYDIAHLHMISHQISPSILPALRAAHVPVVQTLHEYKLICPASHLYIKHKGEMCQRCLHGSFYNVALRKCLKNSRSASILACVAQYFHRWTRIHEKYTDLFICPSAFLAEKHIEAGIPEEKIRVLQNFLALESYQPKFDVGKYGIFLGRLSEEKGIKSLIQAAALAPEVPIVIVGEGEQRPALDREVEDQGLTNITFAGYKHGDELKELVRNSAFLVLPSEWYENCPMVTYEAYASGKPVVASAIGGIPESVDDGETGFLFPPGNVKELAAKMGKLWREKDLCEAMGRQGRKKVENICANHYAALMSLYDEAMTIRRNSSPSPAENLS